MSEGEEVNKDDSEEAKEDTTDSKGSTSGSTTTTGRKRGRPKGSRDPKKKKLKPSTKDAKARYYDQFGELGYCAIYGVDEFTEELIDYLWKKPDITYICAADPVPTMIANLNRKIGSRSMSLGRWEAISTSEMVQSGMFPLVVVASKYRDEVKKLPNPHHVELVVLEDL